MVNDHAIRSGRYVDRPVVHPATSRIQAGDAYVAGPQLCSCHSQYTLLCSLPQYVANYLYMGQYLRNEK